MDWLKLDRARQVTQEAVNLLAIRTNHSFHINYISTYVPTSRYMINQILSRYLPNLESDYTIVGRSYYSVAGGPRCANIYRCTARMYYLP